jgi:hypothetical protein
MIRGMSHRHDEHIHVTTPACASDPRTLLPDPPGVTIHRVPALHPDDVTVVDGILVTSVPRTLIDLADVLTPDELRATFRRAREMGLLDIAALEVSFARVERRPSRVMLRRLIGEFHGVDGGGA